MSNQISTSQSSPATQPSKPQSQKKRFHGKPTGANTGSISKNGNNRNAKRARWAKKSRPAVKPVVRRGPEKEYVCACHGEPARKPRAGTKVTTKDPESGKMKDTPKGLGHWRCSTTGLPTKVSPRKPQPKENPNLTPDTRLVLEANWKGTKIDPYPAPLHTPEVSIVPPQPGN